MKQETITLAEFLKLSKPKNKYFAEKTEVDGIWFDSGHEAQRYRDLKILERCGYIKNLELQPSFRLIVNEHLIATYTADFKYFDMRKGELIVEDAKSEPTRKKRDYRLTMKLFEAIYGRRILET